MNQNIEITVFHEFNSELQTKWNSIEKNIRMYVYQRYSWNFHWYNNFKNEYLFNIVLLENTTGVLGIFPFCINKKGIIKKLQFIGVEQSDYLTPICSPSLNYDLFTEVLKNIKFDYDVIYLKKIPENIKGIKNNFPLNINAKISDQSSQIVFSNSYDEYEKSLKSSFRNDNKRNLKRLTELGDLKFINFDFEQQTQKEFLDFISITLEQKERRIKNHLGKTNIKNNSVSSFYKKSFSLIDLNYKIHYSILMLNNKTILASHWGFYDEDTYYYTFPTIEGREWYKYSAGKVLLNFLIQNAFELNIKNFDFTIGDEIYKTNWINSKMKIFSLQIGVSYIGKFYLLFYYVLNKIKGNEKLKSIWRKFKRFIIFNKKRK